MARPTKQGIDYFPLDVDFDDETELFLAEAEPGYGLSVMASLFQIIYKNHGYYVEYDHQLLAKIKKRCYVPIEKIKKIIEQMVEYSLFEKRLFEDKKILTSKGLQTRFFIAAKKKKEIKIISKFMLISVSDYDNLVSVAQNPVNGGEKPPNQKKTRSKPEEEVEEEVKETKPEEDIIGTLTDNFTFIPKSKMNGLSQAQKQLAFIFQKRGLNEKIAIAFVKHKSPEFLLRKLIQFDYEKTHKELKNPMGYLHKIIDDEEYAPMAGFDDYFSGFKKTNDLPEELKCLL